jgi:hypothetical protein
LFQANGKLYKEGHRLRGVLSHEDAVDRFYHYLDEEFVKKYNDREIVLVAHDAFNSHAKWIVEDLLTARYPRRQIESTIYGFCDTRGSFEAVYDGILITVKTTFAKFSVLRLNRGKSIGRTRKCCPNFTTVPYEYFF